MPAPIAHQAPVEWFGSHRVLRHLLSELQRSDGEALGIGEPLEVLWQRLQDSDDAVQARFAEVVTPLEPALEELIVELSTRGTLPKRRRLDLRTLVQRLTCIYERASAHPVEPELSEQLEVRYAHFDVAELLRNTAAPFVDLAKTREISFEFEAPAHLKGEVDPQKLRIVFLNLLFNAFKYTPRGRAVRCHLNADELRDTFAIEVTDSGPGIPPDQVEGTFHRAREIDRSVSVTLGSLGFSLGASRDLARLHGGDLRLLPRGNEGGCTFRATFAQLAPKGLAVAPHARLDEELPQLVADTAARELRFEARLGSIDALRADLPLVLIVEDSRSIQRILVRCLESMCNTVSAFDGVQGLQKAIQLTPDLIITDLAMPRMDGEAMVKQLRQQPSLADVPILVLSGAAEPMQTVRLLENGVADALRKPFLVQEVRARVSGLLETKRTKEILMRALGHKELGMARLADELVERTRTLQTTLDQLAEAKQCAEKANRIKSNFLRMMSHELRTPLAAMQLHLTLLERRLNGALDAAGQQTLQRIQRSSNKLLHLISLCTEWAQVERGQRAPSAEPLDFATLIQDVAASFLAPAQEKGLDLCVSVDESASPLYNHERVVRLLVVSLIAYALQTTEHGSVSIVHCANEHEQLLRVSDGAPPIPVHLREDIFAPMLSEAGAAMAGAGSGLGLHVVRDVARSIGAEVSLETGLHNTFVIRFRQPGLRASRSSEHRWNYEPVRAHGAEEEHHHGDG